MVFETVLHSWCTGKFPPPQGNCPGNEKFARASNGNAGMCHFVTVEYDLAEKVCARGTGSFASAFVCFCE